MTVGCNAITQIKQYQCEYLFCNHVIRSLSGFCNHHNTLQYIDLRMGLKLPKEHYERLNTTYVEDPDHFNFQSNKMKLAAELLEMVRKIDPKDWHPKPKYTPYGWELPIFNSGGTINSRTLLPDTYTSVKDPSEDFFKIAFEGSTINFNELVKIAKSEKQIKGESNEDERK